MRKPRHLESHKVNENDSIEIMVTDEPGAGGANHEYVCYVPNDDFNEELNPSFLAKISFQNGPIKENGLNGITQETLLAIVEDRLKGFQSGEFASRENAVALTKVQEAMMWLQKRTRDRVLRGVEGTSQK